jgi:hypothetical protein
MTTPYAVLMVRDKPLLLPSATTAALLATMHESAEAERRERFEAALARAAS